MYYNIHKFKYVIFIYIIYAEINSSTVECQYLWRLRTSVSNKIFLDRVKS